MTVDVEYMGKRHWVDFCIGVDHQQMLKLLRALFELKSDSVALLQRESDIMIPISQACKNPQILRNTKYTLITLDEVQSCYRREDDVKVEQKLSQNHVHNVVLLSMVRELRDKVLTTEEANALCYVFQNQRVGSFLLTCAGMTNLLKEGRSSCVGILKDIGIKLLSGRGRGYLRAQEDVLSACNTLIAHKGMDAQQALQIQHLLLTDPEKIVPAFLRAQEAENRGKRRSFSRLVTDLSVLLNSNVQAPSSTAGECIGRQIDKIDELLSAIKVFLVNNSFITNTEGVLLTMMVKRGTVHSEWKPTIEAAIENFQDGDVLELLDTIVRVVKIASKRRPSSLRTMTSKRAKFYPTAMPELCIPAITTPFGNYAFQETYEDVTPCVLGGESEIYKEEVPGMLPDEFDHATAPSWEGGFSLSEMNN